MKRMRKQMMVCMAVMMLMLATGCGKKDAADLMRAAASPDTITILYTNDVHSYIDNVVTDEDGNVTGEGLRFSKIAAMVQDLRAEGGNVLLVDAGDEIQGDIYGAMDQGETVVKLMKETGYQLATPGNHDFDYGVDQFLNLAEESGFPYITCNFRQIEQNESILSDSYVFEIGGKKVAFVGVSTPETIINSTPAYFQNENGEFIYTIDGLDQASDLYASVQKAIDEVKEEADYVIGIGHLGVGIDEAKKGWDSKSVIANVSGLSAFIDGHSHTKIEGEVVKDKDGKDVILTQTGSYLDAAGVMTISKKGKISTKLVTEYERQDEQIAAMEKEWMEQIDLQMNEKIAELPQTLYVNNPDNNKERWIRARELNLGDLTADAVYWFFNERIGLACDIAIQNGGGIRSEIKKGDVKYYDVKQVAPFGNMICMISATGQQIVDALEMGSTVIGEWDEDWNIPAENGCFLHVAGLSYTIDSTIPSSVETDSSGMFKAVTGEHRVKDVQVYNKESGQYEPIDLNRTYQLGGINYLLRNGGNGLTMFDKDALTIDYVGLDYVVLAEYFRSFATEGEYPVINTKNSPLAGYSGYLLDYDNPLGAGRIQMIVQ